MVVIGKSRFLGPCFIFILFFFISLFPVYAIDLSNEEQEYLRTKGTIVFVSQTRYPPFEFVDENNQREGMMLDIARWMAVEMGFKPIFIDMTFLQAQEAILSGKADILTSLFYSDKRKEKFTFTGILFNVPVSIFVRAERTDIKDIIDLKDKTIAIQKGDYAKDFLESKKIRFKTLDTKDFAEATDMVIAGKADAVIGDEQIVLYHIFSNRLTDHIKKVGEPLYTGRNCMASKKDNTILINILNKGVNKARESGILDKISVKWLGTIYGSHKSFLERYLWPLSVATGGILFLSLWVWGWNAKLRMLVRKKTEVITRREEALRESEDKYRTLVETTDTGFVIIDKDGLVFDANSEYVRLSGHHDLSEIIGRSVLEWTAAAEKEKNATAIKDALEKGYIRNLEIEYIDSTGKLTPIEINATTINKEGKIQTITICRDITERKRAEEALRESETRFRTEQEFSQLLLDTSPALIVAIGFDGKTIMMNRALLDILEYTNEEIVGTEYLDTFVPEEDRSMLAGVFQQIINEGKATVNENRIISKSGQTYLVEWHGRTVICTKDDGDFFVGVGIDITEHKKAEEALRASEEKYRELVENANSIILRMDVTGSITFFNEYASRFLGFSRDEIMGRNVVGTIVPSTDSAGNNLAQMIHNIGAHPEQYKNNENENMCKDGKRVWVAWTNKPIFDGQGKCIEVLCIGNDITDLKRTEEEMLTANRLLASVFDSIPDLINVVDREYRIHYTNDKAHNLGKYLEPEKQKVCYIRFKLLDRPCEGCIAQSVFETGSVCEKEVYNPADKTYSEVRAFPVLDSKGHAELVVKHVRDITERKRIEEEKEHLQEQLAQAQRLEFVGRLAGGVAHDFNNMLSVILGHTELALLEVGPEQMLHDNLEEVHKAAEHSADLTRQLLAFARKQTIAPRILKLNETIEGMLMVLRRLIGEDINLAWIPDNDLWQAKIDPAQIDQILVNLMINARDAIADVGKVTIETKNVDFDEAYCAMHFGFMSGKYVKLSVSDTGCGMDQETQAHIFEPFFTTKETGKGTGLGMATVYGIVKQNNGFINLYSEPGRGTTFEICLPRYTGKTVVTSVESPVETPKGGPETVLLVEDEPSILKLGKTILEGLDYRVLTAGTPSEAIRLAENHTGEIHLLISDVVMPEMNGRDLAKKLLSLYPNLKRLFMSGYTANVIAHHGILDEGVNFIQKPFSIKNLAAKVREVLDQE